jgi:hypothetical protein
MPPVYRMSLELQVNCWDPRGAFGSPPVCSLEVPGKVFTMALTDTRLVVGTAGRRIVGFDVRNLTAGPLFDRESSLKYCLLFFNAKFFIENSNTIMFWVCLFTLETAPWSFVHSAADTKRAVCAASQTARASPLRRSKDVLRSNTLTLTRELYERSCTILMFFLLCFCSCF